MPAKKTVIIIAGPTAVGKTSVAIEVAKYFGAEIISADSRQCYKELRIGVARPSETELNEVPHHFIVSHSIHEKVTAAAFENYALQKVNRIFKSNDVAVVVGGTGLYIKAFCEGMDEIPVVPADVRDEISSMYQQNGLEWLQGEVQKFDPKFYAAGEIKNPQRLMRALEVYRATGRSILDFRKGRKERRDFDIVKYALQIPKEQLHANIESRVGKMMEAGLLDEVSSLLPFQHLNALQTVGYKELFDYFNGETDLAAAIALIKRNTKQYAKRQMTWFRKDGDYCWTEPNSHEIIERLSKKQL